MLDRDPPRPYLHVTALMARSVRRDLAELETRAAVDCPDCDGCGSVATRCTIPASYFQPAEYAERRCDRCGGTGEVPVAELDVHELAEFEAGAEGAEVRGAA